MAKKTKQPVQVSIKALSDDAQAKLWAEIRREFETTPIGIRALARDFGIKSHTIVLRKVQSEGWRRQTEMISAHIATEGVIAVLTEQAAGPAGPNTGPQPGAADHAESSELVGNLGETTKRREGVEAGPLAVADQGGAVRAARRMAQVQQAQLVKEINLADQAINLSTQMLGMLQQVLVEEDLLKASAIVRRFSAIGSKQESFSGLMRSAVGGLEKGIMIRRRALQMEGKLGLGQGAGEELPEQVRAMLTTLPTEELMKLRRAAEVMNREIENSRPQNEGEVIEGVASALLDNETA